METSLRGIDRSARGERNAMPAVAGVLALWFVATLGLGLLGIFESGPARPPLAVLAAIIVPPVLFAVAYRTSPGVRAFALGIDLRVLTAIQAWRVAGIIFLALYAFGILPGLFAWPAGTGDVAIGVAAVVVLGAQLRQSPNARHYVFWLNVAGLIDFAGAIATGVLTSNSALGLLYDGVPRASLGALPLSLIPTFTVPFWIICHLISFLQLRR
jgi:hypothetical protein